MLTGVYVNCSGVAQGESLLQGNKVHVIARVDGERDTKYAVCN